MRSGWNDCGGCRMSQREMQGCRLDWYRESPAQGFDLLNLGEDSVLVLS
jgi:hypothetical protein